MRDPGIAAVLSFFIPGIGQIYNGRILRGLFWLIVTPGIWLGTGGWFGWVCHLISAFTALSSFRPDARPHIRSTIRWSKNGTRASME